MESEILAAAAGAAAALLLVGVVLWAGRRRRSRVDLETMLAAAQRECDDLRHRLEELTGRQDQADDRPGGRSGNPSYRADLLPETATAPPQADFVITRAGEPDEVVDPARVPDRLVLSATLGSPLVKVVAFSHGVRRALSPESRNRIRFEIRREVRASRKRRRRRVKDYLRETRAHERTSEGLA